ncbi:unnamed protein product, partial [Clavelina lepadiformis]
AGGVFFSSFDELKSVPGYQQSAFWLIIAALDRCHLLELSIEDAELITELEQQPATRGLLFREVCSLIHSRKTDKPLIVVAESER